MKPGDEILTAGRHLTPAAIGLLALVFTLSLLPLALTLVPLIAALVLGWRTLRSLPEGFTLVPRGPEESGSRTDSPQEDRAAEVDLSDACGVQ